MEALCAVDVHDFALTSYECICIRMYICVCVCIVYLNCMISNISYRIFPDPVRDLALTKLRLQAVCPRYNITDGN